MFDPIDEDDLRPLLETLDPKARATLRRVLIHDQADRDSIVLIVLAIIYFLRRM